MIYAQQYWLQKFFKWGSSVVAQLLERMFCSQAVTGLTLTGP